MSANQKHWDAWNQAWRFRHDYDDFMRRQLDLAVSVARESGREDLRILDVGCGTGWLGYALLPFGRVWGTDLSAGAIADGARRYPELTLICGDFFQVDIPGPFDFVVSADAFVHMPDHKAFVRRVADLLKPGGVFLLMTQNPDVWRRRSTIRQAPTCVPHARPEEWPTLRNVRDMLSTAFTIERALSIDPGGDRGSIWWVENRYVGGSMGRLVGRARWRSWLERAGLGRELVVVARRT